MADQVLGETLIATVAPSSGESGQFSIEAQYDGAASPKIARKGRTRATLPLEPMSAMPASELCAAIMLQQRLRRHYIKEASRSSNATGSLIRRALGWSLALPEKERAKITKQAAKAIKAMCEGEIVEGLEDFTVVVADSTAARAPLIACRKQIEKRMVKLAGQLPVAGWADGVRGFGSLGLAVIIGESGDLSQYATVSKLWKRLGWAPKETYHQGEGGGYAVPRRVKGELYGVVVEPLMKGNKGVYREIYLARKAAYLERGLTKLHAHKLAMRVMLKSLLADLWGAWREATLCVDPKGMMPPADISAEGQ